MAESSLSFHCIVCYETFEHEHNYPVVLPCGHTFVCNECSKRIIKCMECRTSLLYPLEVDPAYHKAKAAAKAEEEINRRLNRNSSNSSNSHYKQYKPKPIHVKPEHRMRLPCPKNLVLLSLMEATIANSQSIDEGAGGGGIDTNSNRDDCDTGKQILAGVNIVTGGCGTYAVTCKDGLRVYTDKQDSDPVVNGMQNNGDDNDEIYITMTESTENGTEVTPGRIHRTPTFDRKQVAPPSALVSPVLIRKAKSGEGLTNKTSLAANTGSSANTTTYHQTTNTTALKVPGSPSLEEMFCTSGRSVSSTEAREKTSTSVAESPPMIVEPTSFLLKFGDHVQVVEFDADGWAKLARGKGYIHAEHGSDLVKIGGPKDKACFVEGMMYSVLHRYMTLQNDQDDLHRMLEVLRKDLDRALWEENDYTIVPAEMLKTEDSAEENDIEHNGTDGSGSLHYAAHKVMPDLPNLDEEEQEKDEEDLRYPTKPPKEDQERPTTPVSGNKGSTSTSAGAFALENIPVFGRFMCGNPERHNSLRSTDAMAFTTASSNTSSPKTPTSRQTTRSTMSNQHSTTRDDVATRSPHHFGINFRTGISGHKGLSSHHATKVSDYPMPPRTETLHLMSVTNGIAPTKRHKAKTPMDARAMWEKEFQEAAKFSSFPGVARRPTPYQNPGSNGAPGIKKTGPNSISIPSMGTNGGPTSIRSASPRAEVNSVVRLPVARMPGSSGGPTVAQHQPQTIGKTE